MKEMVKLFSTIYDVLYELEDDVNYDGWTNSYDVYLENDKEYKKCVADFISERQDFISSDREAAAFAITKYIFASIGMKGVK